MDENPYESPQPKGLPAKGGIRLMTIAVWVMLGLLLIACIVLSVVAYFIAGL